MLSTVVALLCLGDACEEKIVTDQAQFVTCLTVGQSEIVKWMQANGFEKYRLAGYKCVIGPYTPARGT